MKIRIRANSVRVRLTQSEVTRLAAGETVEQHTSFSPRESLSSAIIAVHGLSLPRASFLSSRILIEVPAGDVARWAGTDEVSIDSVQSVDENTTLRLLVEKDFQCLHSKAEGTVDAFPNPRSPVL